MDFYTREQKKHPELWLHAGEPTLMGNGDLISAWDLNMYLFSKQYLEIENDKAKEFAARIRLPFILSYFSAVISVVIFFTCWFIFGSPN